MRFIALFFLHGSSAFGTPYSKIRMVIRIQFYTLEEAKEVYGESFLYKVRMPAEIYLGIGKRGGPHRSMVPSERDTARI